MDDGEFDLRFFLHCTAKPAPCAGWPSANVDDHTRELSAGSGEAVALGVVLPRSAERLTPEFSRSLDTGYSLYPGHVYVLRFWMDEADDLTTEDDLGERGIVLTAENGWGVGTHRLRSTRPDGWGDFEIESEVRRTPLPDLRPVNIRVHDLPGGAEKRVCVAVQNVDVGHADPFEVWLFVDGLVRPDGASSPAGLAPGDRVWACGETELPSSGQVALKAVVDPLGTLIEFDETNNAYQQTCLAARPAPAPSPAPSEALPDLTACVIKVDGRVPEGEDDCKEGMNGVVVVVVTNRGTKKAGDFYVRLVVDGDRDDAKEKAFEGLDAGKEREVRIDDVRLREGERTLLAVADATQTIAESDEDNNDRTVAARCADDD